jgi:hypothetical protein
VLLAVALPLASSSSPVTMEPWPARTARPVMPLSTVAAMRPVVVLQFRSAVPHRQNSCRERSFLAYLMSTSRNGESSPNQRAKAMVRDGVGPHEHGAFGPHEHGPPSYTDAEVAFLQERGCHIDCSHGLVYGPTGARMAPANIGTMLAEARHTGTLTGAGGQMVGMVDKVVSGAVAVGGIAPGEAGSAMGTGPVVRHLDLRGSQ